MLIAATRIATWPSLLLIFSFGCGSPASPPVTQTGSTKATVSTDAPTSKASSNTETSRNPRRQEVKTPVTHISQPTTEQLARWKPIAYEPLELLACRESAESGFVSFMSAAKDEKHYLLCGTNLTLWSVDGTKPDHVFLEAMTKEEVRLRSFAVSPVGNWCVVGDASGLLRTFDIAGRKPIASRETGANAVAYLAISPDGKEIATIPYDREVTIWDSATLTKKTSFDVDTRGVENLTYIGAQTLLAAGESMSSWDTASGEKIKEYPSGRYQFAIGLSPNGRELIVKDEDQLRRWNLALDQASGEFYGGFASNEAIQFTSDGTQMATANSNLIRIWDAASGQLLQVIDAAGTAVSDISWIPNTRLLVVATDMGRTRIWGPVEEGAKFGLTPLHARLSAPDDSPEIPAAVSQNLTIMDLRLLAKPPQSKPQTDMFHSISYQAPVAKAEAETFYRYILDEQGWEETTDPQSPDALRFEHGGFVLSLAMYPSTATETYVNVTFLGNYDLRQTPRIEGVPTEIVFQGESSVIYKAKAILPRIETELLRILHAAGWTAVVRLNASQSEEANRRDLQFVQNGSVLRVSIQQDKDDPTQYVIQYGHSLTLHALPVPRDAGLMEWDDHLEPQMVANTCMSLTEVTAFYDARMQAQGWLPRTAGRRVDDELCYLPYVREQRDVTIALELLPEGLVRVRAGKYSDHSWQRAEAQDEPGAESESEQAIDGLEAADLPILHAANEPVYESGTSEVSFQLKQVSLKE
ncbi:MAG TPA: hypothetical protein VIY86_01605, partial [Pirellulaceae bacterium]